MKKRILSIITVLVLCVSFIIPASGRTVKAAEADNSLISSWALPDIIYGETYGMFPASWAQKSMKDQITQAQMRIALAKLRYKILGTELASEERNGKLSLDDDLSVKEVLEACYVTLFNYDYSPDLGLDNKTDAVDYMKQIGVYTGANGELALKADCSIEQALVITTRLVTYLYDALDAGSKGFLWEMKSEGNTVYLLGSIHLASNKIYPFSSKIWGAYQSADALIVEADVYNQQELLGMQMLAFYTDGTTLKDHVSEECYKKVVETAALLGLTEADVAFLKPWYLCSLFENYVLAGTVDANKLEATLGIDLTFINQAYIYQKPLAQIEGLVKQVNVMDSFSPELQEYLLTYDADSVNKLLRGIGNVSELSPNEAANLLLEYWHKGDVEAFEKVYAQDNSSLDAEDAEDAKAQKLITEYTDKLLKQRDKDMAEYIDALLKAEGSNTYFVVVGAGHYISDYSVIDRLTEKGYVITQVK